MRRGDRLLASEPVAGEDLGEPLRLQRVTWTSARATEVGGVEEVEAQGRGEGLRLGGHALAVQAAEGRGDHVASAVERAVEAIGDVLLDHHLARLAALAATQADPPAPLPCSAQTTGVTSRTRRARSG